MCSDESLKGLVKPNPVKPFGDIPMKKLSVLLATAVASGSTFAADHSEAINSAVTEGQSNYTLVVVGLIGLAAIGFGLRMMMGAMRS